MMTWTRTRWLVILLLVSFVVTSCSLSRVASDITSGIFKDGAPIFEQDSDVDSSEVSGLALLKTLEVFYQGNQSNKNYLLLLSKSYGTYAFGFLENRMIQHKDNPEKYQMYLERAKLFYGRGKQYGYLLLKHKDRGFKKALDGGLDPLRKRMNHYASRHKVAPIFWFAFNWGGLINLSKDDITVVADLPLVEVMISKVLEVHPNFYYAAPHLFYAVYYAARPAMLGGDPEKARQHFEEAAKLTDGKALMVYALEAQYLATQTMDKALFDEMIDKVQAGSVDAMPEQRLANALAKERAKFLKTNEASYFN